MSSSELALVEVRRAVARQRPEDIVAALELLSRFELIPVTRPTLEWAAELPPWQLRTLDAIHIASALLLGSECEGVVTYDARMQEAARLAGLNVAAPGQTT